MMRRWCPRLLSPVASHWAVHNDQFSWLLDGGRVLVKVDQWMSLRSDAFLNAMRLSSMRVEILAAERVVGFRYRLSSNRSTRTG